MATDALFQVASMDWEWEPLGDVCRRGGGDIQTGPFGSQLHASDYVAVGVPSIMPQNISQDRVDAEGIARITRSDAERLSRYLVKPGDIVYSRRGDVERRALITEREDGWLCGTGCLRVRFGEGVVDPVYASYFLSHPASREWVVRHAVGATMPNLNTSILGALPFLLPPAADQRAIADVLGALDDKIEQNRRTARALERTARAMFRAWFVDFEPVKAKAAGATSFPSMPQPVFDALPTRFVGSDIGPVPEWWDVKALSSSCTLISGGTPKRSEATYWGGGVPWYSVKDAPSDGEIWVIKTAELITEDGVANSAARVVPKGCTIISARGTVGKLAMAGIPMAFNQSCYGLMPGDGKSFCYLHLLMQTTVADLKQRTHGSVFDTITRATFDSLLVVLPPIEAVKAFESGVASIFDLLLASLQESSKLAEMRDYLLPKLLSGDVRAEAKP
ncbi:MAG: restriction endonuclease subunit S [Kiritimatiellae bacterium]|nr:restriction endonuclease subunit S [Kiritimatiellia bacterium]